MPRAKKAPAKKPAAKKAATKKAPAKKGAKKIRLWANTYNWMVQEERTSAEGETTWVGVRFYHSIANLAKDEIEQRARYRVSHGTAIVDALAAAAQEVHAELRELIRLVKDAAVPIPEGEQERTRRKS